MALRAIYFYSIILNLCKTYLLIVDVAMIIIFKKYYQWTGRNVDNIDNITRLFNFNSVIWCQIGGSMNTILLTILIFTVANKGRLTIYLDIYYFSSHGTYFSLIWWDYWWWWNKAEKGTGTGGQFHGFYPTFQVCFWWHWRFKSFSTYCGRWKFYFSKQ